MRNVLNTSCRGNQNTHFMFSNFLPKIVRFFIYLWYFDTFFNCNWVVTRWQQYSTHLHTNNTQNETKRTIHRTTQQLWKSAGRAPSWL